MASPRRSPSRLLLAALGVLLLAGCDLPFLASGVGGGTIVGGIDWNGRPAPGKAVFLLKRDEKGGFPAYRPNGSLLMATTDDRGVYTFTDLPEGNYQVKYLSTAVLDAQGNRIGPNEVADWTTPGVNVSATSGGRVGSFEISFNGQIYPETGRNYQVSDTAPLPFHWATHLKANRYKVNIYHPTVGGTPSNKIFWGSDYTTSPSALFQKKVPAGNYSWEVEIKSDAGTGRSLRRTLDLSTPLPQEEPPPEDPGEFPE
ncbi:hypothetical protein D3C86_312590 [compost metagenome]